MVRWRSGTVLSLGRTWRGAAELQVRVGTDEVRALAYPDLVGSPAVGDRVLLNVGAQVMGLGTGGYAMVVAIPDRLPADPAAPGTTRDAGHLVKARYTPLQPILLGVDEEASPHRATMAAAESLDGMPVVTADLHSALPAILAAVHADRPAARVAYVMLDGGALPAWFSRTLDGLAPALAGIITTGQSFGGTLEASTVHTGLLAARHVLAADIAVVTQGPGNLGTGTTWGFSGVSVGEAINAGATLGGRAIGSLRVSSGDGRARHQGVSHHSATAYGRVALAPADIVVPAGLPFPLPSLPRHRIVTVPTDGLADALRASPVPLSTMGRSYDQDPWYFLAAAAAGRHAAGLVV
ncbi:DUF3866 family protein [Actinoplanes sp. NPDC049265]|uniref:DUF3866 family protein n=1 Tax=Actinoplanes sp. NPDC049265 TaxID=3363902 RepID=UPI0037136D56